MTLVFIFLSRLDGWWRADAAICRAGRRACSGTVRTPTVKSGFLSVSGSVSPGDIGGMEPPRKARFFPAERSPLKHTPKNFSDQKVQNGRQGEHLKFGYSKENDPLQ